MDTKDILFICGGAFVDLEKTISERYYVLKDLSTKYLLFLFEIVVCFSFYLFIYLLSFLFMICDTIM